MKLLIIPSLGYMTNVTSTKNIYMYTEFLDNLLILVEIVLLILKLFFQDVDAHCTYFVLPIRVSYLLLITLFSDCMYTV